jgi:hypothetical protein
LLSIPLFFSLYLPYEKEMSGKCHRKCPESIHVVQKISGKCPVKWSNLLSGIFMCRKNWTNSGHKRIVDKFWVNKSRHIPDMKKFWII